MRRLECRRWNKKGRHQFREIAKLMPAFFVT
nr:MAG TPA: hypothetical protein [Caudoviricetes sp.]